MIAEKPSPLAHYEDLRRTQSERLTALLDTLGKVDGLSNDLMEQARDALFHADNPYLIVVAGAFNSGKSSLINALIGEPLLEVSATPTTSRIAILRYGPAAQKSGAGGSDTIFHPAPLLQRVSLVDTPGLDSVFKGHDAITQRFLHRADLVLLVLLATQAMSAANAAYLAALREYGKRVIVVVNQVDLLDEDEKQQVKAFVSEQGKAAFGMTPVIWLISAKLAMDAQRSTPRDEALWKASGFEQIETYVSHALSDMERVRQKLETPLQIARNVLTNAQAQVRAQQDTLADYRRAAQNVRAQIDAALREQEATVRETQNEIEQVFSEAARRGREAIQDVFQWSKAFSLVMGGLVEMIGLACIFRRFGAQTPAKTAFEQFKVDEPLAQIPAISDRLAPRLEGRDVKDVDDLVLYARRELERLPGSLQNKLIGGLQAPATYDRAIIKTTRENLMAALDRARTTEFKRIDRAVRNTIVALAVYELAVFFFGIFLFVVLAGTQADGGAWVLVLLLLVLALIFGGFAMLPLRSAAMQRAHAGRVRAVMREYNDMLGKAAGEQIAYGRRLRQDAVAPFLRMVEAQVTQVDIVKNELVAHEKALVALEAEVGRLREGK